MSAGLRRAARGLLALVLGVLQAMAWLLLGLLALAAHEAQASDAVPRAALAHKAALTRNAQMIWGLQAPVATFAAQIHQESRWRAEARSPVGALGLAQFMPATARWMGDVDAQLLDTAPLNPTWALRAVVSYDRWLWDRVTLAENSCERMAFVLAAYNGGLGWVYKRQRLSPEPGRCLGASCSINPGITAASQAENEHYPRVILQRYEPLYASWGPGSCRHEQ